MSEMLIINPARRRKARKSPARAKRRVTARRRRNPVTALAAPTKRIRRKVSAMRRANPVRRRRRNPISLRGFSSNAIVAQLKNAAIGGAGSVAVDLIMGRVKPMLPAALQTGYAYAGTKMALTVAAGVFGRRFLGPVATKATEGAMIVQMARIIQSFVPASMTMGLNYPGTRMMSTVPNLQPTMIPNMGQNMGQTVRAMTPARFAPVGPGNAR